MSKWKLSTAVVVWLSAALVLMICARLLPEGERVSADEFLWYYLPHDAEKPPHPMEKAKYVDEYNVIYLGDTSKKVIYLTFDDCPNNGNIPKILDILKRTGLPPRFS